MSASDKHQWLLGHEPIGKQINVQKELERLAQDPLEPFFVRIGKGTDLDWIIDDDVQLYRHAYYQHFLSVGRFLKGMSLAIRYDRGPRYVRGPGRRYTKRQAAVVREYRAIAPYLEIDLFTCLLYTRILLDRTIALARYFLTGGKLPSFVSFNDHKKFFKRMLSGAYGIHEEYAEYLRSKTDWFETPLKMVRDKFIVHARSPHMKLLGFPGPGNELGLSIMIPNSEDRGRPFSKVKAVNVSIPRTVWQVDEFLRWFCDYAVKTLKAV